MTPKLILPTLNMNGTSQDELKQLYCNAHDKVDEAIEALRKAMPHGRDYQLASDTYEPARQQHMDRLAVLAAVKEELAMVALSAIDPLGDHQFTRRLLHYEVAN